MDDFSLKMEIWNIHVKFMYIKSITNMDLTLHDLGSVIPALNSILSFRQIVPHQLIYIPCRIWELRRNFNCCSTMEPVIFIDLQK